MQTEVYKFIKGKYVPNILENGEFRITTLHDCQNVEELGEEVGDAGEGSSTIENINIEHKDGNPNTRREIENLAITSGNFLGHPDTIFSMKNCKVIHNYPNCFLLCFSMKNVRSIGSQMGYDACIKIINLGDFTRAITKCIREEYNIINVLSGPTIYSPRTQQHDGKISRPPAFLKDPRYDYQNEFRIIWTTTEKDIQPFTIECKETTKYCELVEYPK